MIQRGYEWRGHWDERGTRVDDGKSVPIRVGVIEVDGHLSIAITVADAPPVAITSQVAVGLGELMQWAQDEQTTIAKHDKKRNRPKPPQADVNQAMTWLDDIDAQLSDIATQVRAMRAHFPASPDDSDTDVPAERGQALADDKNGDG